MKKTTLIITALLSCMFNSIAQISFQKAYGGSEMDYAQSVKQTTDGGYIVSGETYSFGAGDVDIYLIKTDAYGDTLWTKTYGGPDVDWERSVVQTSDGGYIIAGETWYSTLGYSDVYLIKTDMNGNILWTKQFGGTGWDSGNSIEQTTDGGYIVAGESSSFGAGSEDIYLIKTDASGNITWSKTYGGGNAEYGNSVQQTTDGGYIILGQTFSFGAGSFDFYLIRTNASGDTLWTKTYGGADTEGDVGSECVRQTFDGGYILAGSTNSFTVTGDFDYYLIKTDSAGNELWSRTYGGADYDVGGWVEQTADSGYVISGGTASFGSGGNNAYLVKTNSAGDTLWTKVFGGLNFSAALSISVTSDQGYIIAGGINVPGGDSIDFYLAKISSAGISGCNEEGTATIVTIPATQVSNPPTVVSSPATAVTTPAAAQVGNGGNVTTFCTTAINEVKFNNSIAVYPNPSAGNFTIVFERMIMNGNIEILNLLGESVFGDNIYNESKKEINLNIIPDGIYLVKVYEGESYYTRKVIVEHN